MVDIQKLRDEMRKASAELDKMPHWFQVMRARRLAGLRYIEEYKNIVCADAPVSNGRQAKF